MNEPGKVGLGAIQPLQVDALLVLDDHPLCGQRRDRALQCLRSGGPAQDLACLLQQDGQRQEDVAAPLRLLQRVLAPGLDAKWVVGGDAQMGGDLGIDDLEAHPADGLVARQRRIGVGLDDLDHPERAVGFDGLLRLTWREPPGQELRARGVLREAIGQDLPHLAGHELQLSLGNALAVEHDVGIFLENVPDLVGLHLVVVDEAHDDLVRGPFGDAGNLQAHEPPRQPRLRSLRLDGRAVKGKVVLPGGALRGNPLAREDERLPFGDEANRPLGNKARSAGAVEQEPREAVVLGLPEDLGHHPFHLDHIVSLGRGDAGFARFDHTDGASVANLELVPPLRIVDDRAH